VIGVCQEMKRGTGVEAVSVSRFNVSTCNGVVAEAGCQKALEKPMADLEAEDGRPFLGWRRLSDALVSFIIVGLEMISMWISKQLSSLTDTSKTEQAPVL